MPLLAFANDLLVSLVLGYVNPLSVNIARMAVVTVVTYYGER